MIFSLFYFIQKFSFSHRLISNQYISLCQKVFGYKCWSLATVHICHEKLRKSQNELQTSLAKITHKTHYKHLTILYEHELLCHCIRYVQSITTPYSHFRLLWVIDLFHIIILTFSHISHYSLNNLFLFCCFPCNEYISHYIKNLNILTQNIFFAQKYHHL